MIFDNKLKFNKYISKRDKQTRQIREYLYSLLAKKRKLEIEKNKLKICKSCELKAWAYFSEKKLIEFERTQNVSLRQITKSK